MSRPQYRNSSPRLIGTFELSDFLAGGAKSKIFIGVLTRNAVNRTIWIKNTTDQAVNSISFTICDSTIETRSSYETPSVGDQTTTVGASATGWDTSEKTQGLAGHGDSIQFTMSNSGTLPTIGNVQIYVKEVFD